MSFLGIVAALPEEAECLTGVRPVPGCQLRISASVWLKLSGIGAARAARSASVLVEQGASALLSWGGAAGLTPNLGPGDLLVPARVITSDGKILPIDVDWHRRLCAALTPIPDISPLVEVNHILLEPQDKTRTGELTGAVAADMESAAVTRVAAESGVSSLVLRVVVDPSFMPVPASARAAVTMSGARDWWGLARGLCRRPVEAAGLWRLARAFATARKSLHAVARTVGPEFLAFRGG